MVCEKPANYFCADCQNKIDFLYFQPQLPPLIGLVGQLFVLGFFTPPLSTVIKNLKYQSLFPIGSILGDLLYKHLKLPANIDIVTAVPLHPKRQRERGYNQAELVAKQLALRLGKPYSPLLIRQHHTQNLASTKSEQERQQLIQSAFAINPTLSIDLTAKNILLLDDVVTTGATLAACADQLRQAHVWQIFAVATAHEG